MKDLRENYIANPNKQVSTFSLWGWLFSNRYNLLKILGICALVTTIIFPKLGADVIVYWINNFVGTLVRDINIK